MLILSSDCFEGLCIHSLGAFLKKIQVFWDLMLSLGKLLWKTLFSAWSNVMNETLSPEELQWYLEAKCRMLFGLVAAALFSFFELKCACLPDRVLLKFFCWESVYSADRKGRLSDNFLKAKWRVVQFSHTSLFPPSRRRLVRDIGNALILVLNKAVPCPFLAPIKVSAVWIIVF